jgi:hypothetical protein
MKVPEFLAWAETQSEGRYELVDGEITAMGGAGGDILTHVAHAGEIALDPPRMMVPVAALLGPFAGGEDAVEGI